MDTGSQLWQAILESPKDNGLRLVYADWLDESAVPGDCHKCHGTGRKDESGVPIDHPALECPCHYCHGLGSVGAAKAKFIRDQIRGRPLGFAPTTRWFVDWFRPWWHNHERDMPRTVLADPLPNHILVRWTYEGTSAFRDDEICRAIVCNGLLSYVRVSLHNFWHLAHQGRLRRYPLTQIALYDLRPRRDRNKRHVWRPGNSSYANHQQPHLLPERLYWLLPGVTGRTHANPSESAALAALSEACLAYVRTARP